MPNVTFVKTRYQDIGYGSYQDFWKLVQLSGYNVCYVDEIDAYDPSKCYIITPLNDEWLHGWEGAKARIIHYELEWRTDWRAEVNEPLGISEVWCGDAFYAKQIGARYVPLGSHPSLNEYPSSPKISEYTRYDVAFMGYTAPPRRARILAQMQDSGLHIAPNSWGQTRSADLLDSRCMVAIHQWDNMPTIPPLRMCIAAAHKLAVISENVIDRGLFEYPLFTTDYMLLAKTVELLVNHRQKELMQWGEDLFKMLCVDYTFRASIEAAL